MFDIGFAEIVLVFIVGLLVLGPEKMPQAVRSVAKSIKKIKDMAKNVQSELDQELKVHEIQEQIKKVKGLDIESFMPETTDELNDIKKTIKDEVSSVKQHSQNVTQDLKQNVKDIQDSINAEIDFDQDHDDEDLYENSEKTEKSVAVASKNSPKSEENKS